MGKAPTKKQRERWGRIAELGCLVQDIHFGRMTIHHCGTSMGCKKNHDLVLGLCWRHHLSREAGIDGKGMGKRVWEEAFGTERELLEEVAMRLGEK